MLKRMILVLSLFITVFFTSSFAEKALEASTWDFGKIKHGEVVKHVFQITNTSRDELNIKDSNTSCGCTVSEIKKKKLFKGESADLEVKFDSKGYGGAVKQFVYVNTDDPDNPVIRFIIKAEVKK